MSHPINAMFVLARQGRVHSIDASCRVHGADARAQEIRAPSDADAPRGPGPAVRGRSLLGRFVVRLKLKGTWDSTFGGAAVGSTALRKLRVTGGPGSSGLRGPLPELRLPALQELDLGQNQFTGGLEPLKFCTGLQTLNCNGNRLTGGLEPLRNCIGLRELNVSGNRLTGGLDALRLHGAEEAPAVLQPSDWDARAAPTLYGAGDAPLGLQPTGPHGGRRGSLQKDLPVLLHLPSYPALSVRRILPRHRLEPGRSVHASCLQLAV